MRDRRYNFWSKNVVSIKSIPRMLSVNFELTYRCPLHCLHCYSDCYNSEGAVEHELETSEVKTVLDKIYNAGCLWLTFTGGDPLMRNDFIEIYRYAQHKGFIISVMTSLNVLNEEILNMFTRYRPFYISTSLNAVTEKLYNSICQAGGTYEKTMYNIKKILNSKIHLKTQTVLAAFNFHELRQIEAFCRSKEIEFRPNALIFARLNGDFKPCRYRLPISVVLKEKVEFKNNCAIFNSRKLFKCDIASYEWVINPSGYLASCTCVREPSFNLLDSNINEAVRNISSYLKSRIFLSKSKCKNCQVWMYCHSCPGMAKLECNDWEAPISYYCDLAWQKAADRLTISNNVAL